MNFGTWSVIGMGWCGHRFVLARKKIIHLDHSGDNVGFFIQNARKPSKSFILMRFEYLLRGYKILSGGNLPLGKTAPSPISPFFQHLGSAHWQCAYSSGFCRGRGCKVQRVCSIKMYTFSPFFHHGHRRPTRVESRFSQHCNCCRIPDPQIITKKWKKTRSESCVYSPHLC